jgi:ElaB/YqjD/DUF883 family membrane-anchored ribosome-binding protein
MGEDPGATSATVTGSADPENIRRDIEATREELGDTVAALAAKTDVKAQARQRIDETKAAVSGKKEELLGRAKEASPESASAAAMTVTSKARQNPVPTVAAGAFAFGFVAGWLLRR